MVKPLIRARLSTKYVFFPLLIQVRAGSRALYRPLSAAVVSDARKADVSSHLCWYLELIYWLSQTRGILKLSQVHQSPLLFSLPCFSHTTPLPKIVGTLCKMECNHFTKWSRAHVVVSFIQSCWFCSAAWVIKGLRHSMFSFCLAPYMLRFLWILWIFDDIM